MDIYTKRRVGKIKREVTDRYITKLLRSFFLPDDLQKLLDDLKTDVEFRHSGYKHDKIYKKYAGTREV